MEPKDVVIIAVLVLILGAAIFYMYRAKKSGKKCIGCPDAGSCGADKGGCSCGCCGGSDQEK